MHVIDRITIACFQNPPPPARPAPSTEAGPSEPAISVAEPEHEQNYGLSDEPLEPHPGRMRLLQERVATMETELFRACVDIRAQYQQMGAFMESMTEQKRREAEHFARMEANTQRMEARE